MPRGTKSPRRAAATPALRAEVVLAWRDDPEITRLTGELLSITRKSCEMLADFLVQIGLRLATVRARIGEGQWLDWLAHSVPYQRHSARNYIVLAAFATAEPREYARLRPLGPSKLYKLILAEPVRRRALLLGRVVTLPDGRRKTPETMRVTELALHLGLTAKRGSDKALDEAMQTLRYKLASLSPLIATIARHRTEIDRAEALKLHGELAELFAELTDALGL